MNAKNIYDAFREVEEQKILINKYHKEIQRLNMQNKACQERIKVLERALDILVDELVEDGRYNCLFCSKEKTCKYNKNLNECVKNFFISQAEKEK